MSKTKDFSSLTDDNQWMKDEKLIYPAATRNKEPILQVLKRFLSNDTENSKAENPVFLEIASGSGQHISHFAPHFPNIQFQPTEFDESLLGSIRYYVKNCHTGNILLPIIYDIRNKLSLCGFSEHSIDYIYNANMIHISPYECTVGLFENAGNYLKPNGLLITYGPYSQDGVITPQSNKEFDASLRSRNPSWGLRDIAVLIQLAKENNLSPY